MQEKTENKKSDTFVYKVLWPIALGIISFFSIMSVNVIINKFALQDISIEENKKETSTIKQSIVRLETNVGTILNGIEEIKKDFKEHKNEPIIRPR